MELGERENGELAFAEFEICNDGDAELLLDDISTSCSCTGLEKKTGDDFARISTLKIAPRSSAKVAVRLSVRGFSVGGEGSTFVNFRTNDPNNLTGSIKVHVSKVKGGVHARPNPIVFGTVCVGDVVKSRFEIVDDAVVPRRVRSIQSQDPEKSEISHQPKLGSGVEQTPVSGDFKVIEEVEVEILTSKRSDNDIQLIIHLEGDNREPDVVRLVGRIVAPIELSPPEIVLPRRSSEGLVLEAKSFCRSVRSEPFTLGISETPHGIKVSTDSLKQTVHIVTVQVDKSKIQDLLRDQKYFEIVSSPPMKPGTQIAFP